MSTMTAAPAEEPPLPWKNGSTPARISGDPLRGIEPKYIHKVNGRPVAFWTIGTLARVLGDRKADTLRGWEENGWLPVPTANFTGRDPRSAASARHGRRRLYTRAQILGIYQIAYEEGILEKHSRPIQQTAFTKRVKKLFEDLAAREVAEAARKDGGDQ